MIAFFSSSSLIVYLNILDDLKKGRQRLGWRRVEFGHAHTHHLPPGDPKASLGWRTTELVRKQGAHRLVNDVLGPSTHCALRKQAKDRKSRMSLLSPWASLL